MKQEKKTFECTITPVLFETIKLLRRHEDAKTLTETTGFSRPVIDKALTFGHIRDSTLEVAIINFYQERQSFQENAAKELLETLIKE